MQMLRHITNVKQDIYKCVLNLLFSKCECQLVVSYQICMNREGKSYVLSVDIFFYLTDVEPGDGGLIVIPGSHKSKFERPEDLLTPGPDVLTLNPMTFSPILR